MPPVQVSPPRSRCYQNCYCQSFGFGALKNYIVLTMTSKHASNSERPWNRGLFTLTRWRRDTKRTSDSPNWSVRGPQIRPGFKEIFTANHPYLGPHSDLTSDQNCVNSLFLKTGSPLGWHQAFSSFFLLLWGSWRNSGTIVWTLW